MALSKQTKRRNATINTTAATSRRAFSTNNRKLDSSSLPSPLSPSPPSSRVALVPLRINLRRLPSRQFPSSQSTQISATLISHHPSPPSSPDEDAMMFTPKTFVKAGTKRKRSVSGAENATSTAGRVAPQRATRGTVPRGRYKRQKSESILGSSESDEDLDDSISVSTKTTDTNSAEEDEEVDLVATDDEENDEDAETVGSAMEVDVDDDVDGQDVGEEVDSENDSGAGDSSDEYYLNDANMKELLRLRKDALVRLYTCAGLSDDFEALTKHDLAEAIISARDDIVDLPPSSPSGCTSSDGSSDDGHFGGGEETDVSHRFRPAATNGLRRRVTVHNVTAQPTRRAGRTISLGQFDKEQFDTKLNTAIAKYSNLGVRSKSSTARSSPSNSHASSSLPSPPATRQRARKVSVTQGPKNGKGKQVDFEVEVEDPIGPQDSDLTDLTELEDEDQPSGSPSPRRLRSKGDKTQRKSSIDSSRKAAFAQKLKNRPSEHPRQDEDEELPDASDDDEEQPVSTPSKAGPSRTAARGRRTPVKSRLRPRQTQTHTPPSDGDDEEEEEEEQEIIEGDGEEGDIEEDQADLSDDDTEATPVEPRVLRNGKVVSTTEEAMEMEEVEDEISVDGDETVGDETASVQSESTSDVEGEEEEEEEDMEGDIGEESMDEFDLSTATTKWLTRLRRDDLVRLCEARDLDTSGTKPQLARALIKWRDQPIPESSCPSSTGTVRPQTRSSRSRGSKGKVETHVHPPQTPPVSNPRDIDPDVDLDLSSLGLHDREIPPDKITKLSKIGSGGFKDVFIGKLKARRVAIAEFRGQLNSMDIKELKLLGDFNHPNIVRFLGVSIPLDTRESPVMIISELCSNGDLFDYLRGSPVPAVRRMACMMLDIAHGIQYLHNHKPSIIHRDCKSSNILITSKGVAKITDFGLAKVKQSTRSMVRSLVGTVNWQAPELWHPQPKYNFKVDVFSCAMVYWEMFQWHLPDPKYPWEGMNEHAIYDIVGAKRQRPATEGLQRQWRPELVNLMERMWVHDPAGRPNMDEVVTELEEIFNRL